jgi:hypothetical protein
MIWDEPPLMAWCIRIYIHLSLRVGYPGAFFWEGALYIEPKLHIHWHCLKHNFVPSGMPPSDDPRLKPMQPIHILHGGAERRNCLNAMVHLPTRALVIIYTPHHLTVARPVFVCKPTLACVLCD